MKKNILFLALLLAGLISGLRAQTQFWVDNFESTIPSSGTRTPKNNGGVGGPPFTSYFCRTPANGTVSQSVPFSGFQGTNYWAGEDQDAAGTGFAGAGTSAMSVRQQDITWTSINIVGKTNLSFTGSFAANSTNQPFDNRNACSGGATTNTDYVILQYRIDAGPWNDGLRFFTNGALTGKYLFLETTGDSCGDGAQLLNVFHDFNFDIVGTGANINLRLLVYSEGGNEEWGVDNFRLFEVVSTCTPPVIVSDPSNRNICAGNNTTFAGSTTGATTYQWQVDDGSGFTDLSNTAPYSGVTSNSLSITGATSAMNGYKYRYTAINGVASCTTNSGFGTLSVSSISTTATQTNVTCNAGNNGAASVAATGGIGSNTYTWSPSGGTGSTATGLSSGVYTVSINDAIGCPAANIYTITEPSAIITTTGVTIVTCNSGSNGSATITATGGAGSYTYLWSNGATTSAISGLLAGAYSATVTDANSCTAIKSAVVTQPSAIVTNTAMTPPMCNSLNGSATVTASGGTGAYSYTWSSGPTTSVEPTLLAGTYTVKVTDANSCSITKSVTITQPSALLTSTAVTNVACNGGSNGSATLTPSGGTGSYTYLWSNGATTSAISGLLSSAYSATVTDANNCRSIKSINVTQPSALGTSTAVTNVACNGGSNGSATITPSGGASGYTYLWSNGATTSAISGLLAGAYSATVTDANSCTSIKSAVITQPSALATTTAVTNVACNGGSNGSATITPSGGVGGYTYLWSNGATTSAISGLLAGAYSATVTDANSCTSIKSANVSQPNALVTSTAVTNVACNGGSNGVASITASGGAGGYTYLWSNGATTSAITGLTFGVYTATVTDANSCTSIKSANISQPSALITSTAVTNVACNSGSNGVASITASGGAGSYTYLWSNGATTSAITGLTFGVYTATVTDANSCTSIKSANISQPNALVTTTAVTNVACNGGSNGSATITASGGAGSYTYLWSNGATTSAISGLLSGAYSATVTDANSCTSIKSANISQPNALVTTTAVTNIACNGGSNGSATITASGGAGSYTYLWSNGATTSAISGLLSGAYSATVTDANSCTSIKSAVITQPSALGTTTAVTNVACNGGSNGSATITASGGAGSYTYLWSNGATTSAITGLTFGVYTATVTDANSCTSIKSANISQPNALVTTTAVTNVACNGSSNGSATITASGGAGSYTYLWSNGATTSAITGLTFGVYTATVTDANSCTSIKSANISQPNALVTTTAVTNVACNGGSNGSATITPSGGTGAYTYLWSNGATTSAISGLLSGAYSATVTDANSCTSIKSANISQPSALITSTAVTNVACNGGSNGSATITPSGGTGAYTYLWSNGATTSAISGLLAGAYSATVTDANSCTSIKSAVITQPSAIVTTTAVTNVACNGGSNGSATISATGGTGAYTYLWSNGATTSAISGLLGGAYSATVTDANSCTSIKSVNISQPATLTLTATTSTSSVCAGTSATLTANASGGTGTIAYSWVSGPSTATYAAAPSVSTIYTVNISDANSCSKSETVSITMVSSPTLSVNSATICSGNSVAIVPGGANTYTITGSSYTVSPNTTTSYSVTGTALNGCTGNTAISTISVNTTPTLTVNNATICSGNSVAIVPGGASTYTITGGNFTVTPLTNTSYSVTGKSAAGCAASNTAVSTVSVNTTPTLTVNSATICSGNSVAIVPNGANGYTITGGSFTVSPNATTSYSVTGTATNGCTGNTAVSTVSVNATPTVTVNSATVCSGSSVAIVANGATTYTITGNNFTVTPNTTTSYTVNGTSNGCVSSNAVSTISVNTTPTLTLNSGAICPGNTYTLQATGAGTYTYSSGSNVVSPAVTTTYSATGTGTNGCPAFNTATATVSVVNTLTVSVSGATNVCSGTTTTLTVSGATTYSWNTGIISNTIALSPTANTTYTVYGASGTCSNSAVVTLSLLTTPTITVNSATICSGASLAIVPTGANSYTVTGGNFTVTPASNTNYSVTGTATNGCLSNIAVSNVSVNASPTVVVNSATVCSGTSVAIVPTGANTYTITGGSYTVTPGVTTTYSVTGTATNGCVSSNTAVSTVSVNTTPTITANGATICSGNVVAIIRNGAGTYTITGGSFTISPASTTSYSITGTGTNGCISSNTAVVTISVNVTPTISVNNATICSGNSVTLTPSGAGSYTITGGTFTVTPAVNTSYTVTGTGANGCPASNVAIATISVNASPTLAVTSATICSGNSAVIVPVGASTYTISGNTFTVNPTITTSYSVTGAGANGCVSSNTAIAVVSVDATPTLSVNDATICSGNSAVIVPTGAGSYTITGGTFTVSPAANTTYSVTGTGPNGCVASNTAVASVLVNNTPTLTVNNATVCAGSSVVIVPTGANTYTITGNTFTVTPAANESYSVTGSDLNGCVSAEVVSTVSVNPLPVVTVSTSDATICINGTASLTASGATSYTWNTTQTDPTIAVTSSVTGTETYTVTGTDANGCMNIATVSQVIDNCTAIKSIAAESIIFGIYPNPNTGRFLVEAAENVHISVVNSIGQTVYSETTTGTKTSISIDHLANGIYFIKATANGSQQVVKIIKE